MSQDVAPHAEAAVARRGAHLPQLPRIPTPLQRVIRYAVRSIGALAGILMFFAAAITLGVGTAWYATQSGLPFNTERNGPWVLWNYAGATEDDPYSRARFAALNTLSMSGDRVFRYEARTDSEGRRLHSSCVYEIASAPLAAEWWNIAVFDSRGALVSNAAERYGFNRASVARDGRGHFAVSLSRDAQSGNWLPTGAAGRMVVVLELIEPGVDDNGTTPALAMPPIRRVSC